MLWSNAIPAYEERFRDEDGYRIYCYECGVLLRDSGEGEQGPDMGFRCHGCHSELVVCHNCGTITEGKGQQGTGGMYCGECCAVE